MYDSLERLGDPAVPHAVNASTATFPDGGRWRTELPSCEGPAVLAAVLEESRRQEVPLHRISQGSGVWMLADGEISEMVAACAELRIELCLFLGPRGTWAPGPVRSAGPRARGRDQVAQCLADAERAAALGVKCLLLADEGVLWSLHRMRAAGLLPEDTTLKVSGMVGPVNPVTFAIWEQLGADSINVPSDLTFAEVAELRSYASAPIDMYVEAPDGLGGHVRLYDAAELIRVGAPVYLKFGLRNAPDIYPSGRHLLPVAVETARERVRRGRLVLDTLVRLGAAEGMSPPGSREPGELSRFAIT